MARLSASMAASVWPGISARTAALLRQGQDAPVEAGEVQVRPEAEADAVAVGRPRGLAEPGEAGRAEEPGDRVHGRLVGRLLGQGQGLADPAAVEQAGDQEQAVDR